jgi:sugar/nucleoside kinase (ribokinase family)
VNEPRALDLLVIGDANPDVILTGVPRELAYGQAEQLVSMGTLTVGGSAAILACGAARLGLRTGLVAVVGDDAGGRFMLEELRGRGVDVSGCHVVGSVPSGITVNLVRDDDRAVLTANGAIPMLDATMVERALLRSARHVHTSAFFLHPALAGGLRGLFDEARAAGASTSLDTNWDPTGRWDGRLPEILPAVDFLFVNEQEAYAIAGVTRDIDAAMRTLAKLGPLPVVKRGAQGALAGGGTHLYRALASVVRVADPVGAGDSFDAGFLCGHLAGWDTRRCLALAVACGSLSTRARGGVDGQPTLAEAEAAVR